MEGKGGREGRNDRRPNDEGEVRLLVTAKRVQWAQV